MSEYQSVFRRVEKKYLLGEAQYMALRQRLEDFMKADQFAQNTVCNIYFDTPDYRLIRRSLEKPVYKEKLRLRSYGTPEAGSTVFLELKKKFKGVVYKRRVDLTLSAAEAYLYGGVRPEGTGCEEQILKEIDWVLKYYGQVRPVMYLSYERSAYCGKGEPGLRITFDTNIRYRREELSLESGPRGAQLLTEGSRLMEIKMPESMPIWLSQLLSELEIYPRSFSKYGQAYLAEQTAATQLDTRAVGGRRHDGGGKICA